MSVIESARRELALANFGAEDSAIMIAILTTFFKQWNSGGAVFIVAPILQRLIAHKPLTPLTGADDEWIDRSELGDGPIVAQNIRCSTVFKMRNGTFVDCAGSGLPRLVSFPYMPADANVEPPEVSL